MSGLLVIAVVVVALIIGGFLLHMLLHRLSRSSRGGVAPRRDEFRRGDPPFEGIGRRR